MQQMKILDLIVDGSESVVSPDYWESVFIGVPASEITALRENDCWENVKQKLEEGTPTITMLKALKTLILRAVVKPVDGQAALSPLISDLTLRFALMKMNLKELYLHGRFKITEEMTTTWKDSGRFLTYSPNEEN